MSSWLHISIQEMGAPSFSDPCSLPGWHKQCRRGGWVESIRISSKSTRWQNYWHHAFYCISEQPYESLRSIITYSLPKKYSKAYIKGPLSRRFKWNKRTFFSETFLDIEEIARHSYSSNLNLNVSLLLYIKKQCFINISKSWASSWVCFFYNPSLPCQQF